MGGSKATAESLRELNLRAHQLLLWVILPGDLALFGVHYYVLPCWQFAVLVVGGLVTYAGCVVSYSLARRSQTEASVALTAAVVYLHAFSAVMVRDGSLTTFALTVIGATIYVSFFSRRLLYVFGAAMIAMLGAFEVCFRLGLLALARGPQWLEVAYECGLLVLIVPMIIYFMIARDRIGRIALRELEDAAQAQREVLAAVSRTLPKFDRLVVRLQEASGVLASQARQQAATAAEVTVSMQGLVGNSIETARAAGESKSLAETSRVSSARTGEQLQVLERHFGSVIATLEGALSRNRMLAQSSKRSGAFIEHIRDVDNQVNMLALNAAIEATRAGEAGRTFAIVARELRSMMDVTAASSHRGASLLQQIEREAGAAVDETAATLESVHAHLAELREAGEQVHAIVQAYAQTSERVERIASASDRQRTQAAAVGTAMTDVSRSAAELMRLASEVEASMRDVAKGSEELRGVVGPIAS
jgi:methyl-accepting chemotaxis protein